MNKLSILGISLVITASLCACGSEETVSSVVSSQAPSEEESVVSQVESQEEISQMEESVVEEELTVDEEFELFLQTADGPGFKLQIYDQKGFPVKNATVTLARESTISVQNTEETAPDSGEEGETGEADPALTEEGENSEQTSILEEEIPEDSLLERNDDLTTATNLYTTTTDGDGYVFLDGMEEGEIYRITVSDEDGAPVGVVTLTFQYGTEYSGTVEDGIVLTLTEEEPVAADLAITATEEDGSSSSFTLNRIAQWAGN